MRGIFIVLEGPDGSGKSTMASMIGEYYKQKGREIIFTREPGGTKISEKIRNVILDNDNSEMSYNTEALLYAASRAQLVSEKIKPLLQQGKVVISERYVYSSIVYQGIGRKLGIDKIKLINDFATNDLKPDLVLFFDIDPEKALNRKLSSNNADRLENEKLSFHREVYEGYKEILNYYDEIVPINADKKANELFNEIKNIIDNLN
ncbi:dTMP kinase [Sedimentibacter sp. zth1]|uniref:dTMP kinase n=1 Tax=Sedimentibacter sp. zth1 TaxID=2816908 RepID=UPI001A910F52|nr:dTMP kinase [Sedimentibacter sp. zth1]QSX04930.1 dTMP kinase [Sedimentibacter sp. zth1]